MGESQNQPFQLSFNRFLRVDFQGCRVTSDGGLILVRELVAQAVGVGSRQPIGRLCMTPAPRTDTRSQRQPFPAVVRPPEEFSCPSL